MPKSLLEAAACGRPVVTTDTTGCRDVVEDGKTGVLVPLYDSEGLADALEKLAQSKDLRLRMGALGRERVVKLFSEKITVEKTMGLYQKTLAEK